MKKISLIALLLAAVSIRSYAQQYSIAIDSVSNESGYSLFAPTDSRIQYTGRIDFSDPDLPKLWSPGINIQTKFSGSSCEIKIIDEQLYWNYHNYLEIVVDNKPSRIQTKHRVNYINISGLENKEHLLTIYKNTEASIGYIEFAGIRCHTLLNPPSKPLRKIEFIGNSITCGYGSDMSSIPCKIGQWYDQHNAYMSYGALTARALNAQWVISAVSGIGMIHSCCQLPITMPQVFNKIDLRDDSINWNFKNYQPNVVTICLGQNDGIQDSTKFCSAYVDFIKTVRGYYPNATIFCLTSPMADAFLNAVLKNYLTSIVAFENNNGDKNIYKYFFSKRYYRGCDTHPSLEEHAQMAKELTPYIKKVMKW